MNFLLFANYLMRELFANYLMRELWGSLVSSMFNLLKMYPKLKSLFCDVLLKLVLFYPLDIELKDVLIVIIMIVIP